MFNDIVQELKNREPLPSLFPKAFDAQRSSRIQSADDQTLFGEASKVLSAQQKLLLRAGLLVWSDDIAAAHNIVQSVENATGSFWHAIIHRREGDASNSNYWWRRTDEHPAFALVLNTALSTLDAEGQIEERNFVATLAREQRWLPIEFVKVCETARQKNSPDEWLRQAQVAEIESLLTWCRENHE